MKAMSRALLTASVIAFAVAGVSGAGYAQQKLSLSKIKIAMPFTVLVQRAALEAAQRTDAFKAEGLEVEVLRFRSWTEPVQAIAGDAAQFALGGGSLMRSVVGRKAPVRQIAMVSSRYPYVFWAKRGGGIKSVGDLRGKRLQTVRAGETLDNVWKQVLGDAGLKMIDVKRVESFNGFGTLVSNSTDIANISSTFMGKARKVGFVRVVDYTDWRKQHGLPISGGANLGWGTSLKMTKDHPDTVRAFLRALARSTVRLKKDKTFAVSVLKAKPYSMDDATAAEVWDLHRGHWMLRMDLAKGDFTFDREMVEIAMKRPNGSIDLKTVVDAKPINDVLRELKLSF